MWTILRQRLAILIVAILGGAMLAWAGDAARAPDGAEGVTLVLAGSAVSAVLMVLIVGLVVSAIAAVVGMLGNPIVGVFTFGIALTVAAVSGGTIDATLRSAASPSVYWALAFETVIWTVLCAVFATVIVGIARWLGPLCPWNHETPDEPSDDEDDATRIARKVERRRREVMDMFRAADRVDYVPMGAGLAVVESVAPGDSRKRGWAQLGLCTIATALIGGAIMSQLLRSEDAGQVVGALIASFTIGGVVAHQLFPSRSPLPAVLAPGLVGVIGHVLAAIVSPDGTRMLAAYFGGDMTGAALALPVYFLSAGMMGAALGMGWSQAMLVDRVGMGEDEEIPEPHVEPAA